MVHRGEWFPPLGLRRAGPALGVVEDRRDPWVDSPGMHVGDEGAQRGIGQDRDRAVALRNLVLDLTRTDDEGLGVVEEAPGQPGVVAAERGQIFSRDDPMETRLRTLGWGRGRRRLGVRCLPTRVPATSSGAERQDDGDQDRDGDGDPDEDQSE